MEKSILITGCSSGIGLATCRYLKEKGYRVFASARKAEDVAELKTEGFEAFQLDVNNTDQIKTVIAEITELTGGKLYALCNNAGYAQPGALEDISRETLRLQYETLVFGPHEVTREVLPLMRRQGYGRIVLISSVLGIIALPFRGAYVSSKHALEGWADTLRLELKDTNIFVSLVEPGPIESNIRVTALENHRDHIRVSGSPFEAKYKQFFEGYRQNKAKGIEHKPVEVAKRIYEALESKHPKARYFVTSPTYILATLKRLLPHSILDRLLKKIGDQELR